MTSINCTAIAGSGVILIDGVPLPSPSGSNKGRKRRGGLDELGAVGPRVGRVQEHVRVLADDLVDRVGQLRAVDQRDILGHSYLASGPESV